MKISVEKLLQILWTDQLQDIEDATQTLLGKWDVDNLEGEPLKEVGKVVGLSVYPTDTDTLRAFIKAKAVINASKGTFNDIYTVAKGISDALGGTQVIIKPFHPQQLNIYYDVTVDPTLASQILSLFNDCSGVEVKIAGIESITTEGDGIFKYDSTSALDAYDAGVYTDFMRNR